jgi:hypothetical protein
MVAVLAGLGGWAAVANACDTPVYRYAMYRWEPAPYEVYYFHDAEPDENDQLIADELKAAWESNEERANVVYIPVDMSQENALNRVPPDVRQAYESRENPELPLHMIWTPYPGSAELFYGKLKHGQIAALIDSPMRQKLAGELAAGKIGAFLFLPGSDEAANQRTEKVLSELVKDLDSGKLAGEFYSPYGPPMTEDGEEVEEAAGPKMEVGLLKVDREDPAEQWLVRCLLATEPDLDEEDGPMAFLCYGRGRTMWAYIDKGISRENMLDVLFFVTGACSCTVKEQNPGVDLLVRHDWDAAAMAMAENFGAEEGNEYGPGMFYPELIVPGGGDEMALEEPSGEEPSEAGEAVVTTELDPSAEETPPADPETDAADVVAQASAEEQITDAAPTEPTEVDTAAEIDDAVSSSEDPAEESETAVAAAVRLDESPEEGSALSTETSGGAGGGLVSVMVVGAGVVVALLALFGLTFYVLRPQ